MKLSNFQFPISKWRNNVQRFTLPGSQRPLQTTRGYSLVEVLVSITVLLVALVGPLTIAQKGLQRAMGARDQTLAVFLAQEGIESIFKIREDAALAAYQAGALGDINAIWKNSMDQLHARCPATNPCGVTIGLAGEVTSASVYRCNATNCEFSYTPTATVPYRQNVSSGTATGYKRELSIVVNDAVARVTSRVNWGHDNTVVLETYIYNIYHEIEP